MILAELESNPPPGCREWIPAFTTVLFLFDQPGVPALLPFCREIGSRPIRSQGIQNISERPVTIIPTIYDGQDLERVATYHNFTPDEVVKRHQAPIYLVHCIGFSPGFP